MESRTLFIKPSRPVIGEVKLDPVLVTNNIANGIETSLTLDTNILIEMERVVKEGNKWSSVKKHGLHNLVKLLQRCPPQSICISPGFSLNEMPPGRAQNSREKYEEFCAVHLPGFVDAPNCIKTSYQGKKEDYGYLDLSIEAQSALAIPFACILYLNIIDKKSSGKPIDKFKEYLSALENKLDCLSSIEIDIAKYCFANPPANCRETIEIRKKIRKNFLKTGDNKAPKSSSDVLAIAFNGACDIHLLQVANTIDTIGLDGVKQDSWIATQDKKLLEFCKIFHHVNIDGEAGKYSASTALPEHAEDVYWMQAELEFGVRSISRKSYSQSRKIDFTKLVGLAKVAIAEVEKEFL